MFIIIPNKLVQKKDSSVTYLQKLKRVCGSLGLSLTLLSGSLQSSPIREEVEIYVIQARRNLNDLSTHLDRALNDLIARPTVFVNRIERLSENLLTRTQRRLEDAFLHWERKIKDFINIF